jgi:hypothetical protein
MKSLVLMLGLACTALNTYGGGTGLPSRAADLDVLPGFTNPPPGYGEVPFWWWTGDTPDSDRLIEQIKKLNEKGISGVQVNYSHYDTQGWMTEQDSPQIFSEEWWKVYEKVAKACADRDMGIGLSTYTIDWPNGAKNLFYDLFYSKSELNAIQLKVGEKIKAKEGDRVERKLTEDVLTARAYLLNDGKLERGGMDLKAQISDGNLSWIAPAGNWEVWIFIAERVKGSINPMMPGAGDAVVKGFFQPFEDHAPNRSSKGLNYFFNDELHIGVGKYAWVSDFSAEFAKRKGYDLMEVLPAMWQDIGPVTQKVLMDYADVRMSLMEERYFKPIYNWHASRGMIYACDSGGRGLSPNEFGDYFRVTRWYSAPGHDTPGGKADLIKGKVSSSVANLYQRPRVWLEGYHSLGWGAAPELLMFATRENYLYGTTLLNLHGLYYSTYGSYWEWAPPCYHFRMPYWAHMSTFLKYFDRLSYLLSQGHLACDVAIVYPVAPYEAEMDGNKAKDAAFDLARNLFDAGINFEFIDNESLARAVVADGKLQVKDAGASYRALVFPNMNAVRWPSIDKAAEFAKSGGKVYCVGQMPAASDRAGRDDKELAAMNDLAFAPECRMENSAKTLEAIRNAFVQDVCGIDQNVRAMHRKAGPREIYMVMGAQPGKLVEFRSKGAVELWDPWTGANSPLRVAAETATGTQVELPLEAYEANIVVFTPGKVHVNPPPRDERPEREKALSSEWNISFEPTMDNSDGDFRRPVTPDNKMIGVEARRFSWARENDALAKIAMLPATDDRAWERDLHGFGTQFYVLGPVPKDVDAAQVETELAKLANVDPKVPLKIGAVSLSWKPYDFSWRFGKEDDSGHQGYHGLKRTVTDDFLCLGKTDRGLNETRYVDEEKAGSYYLWTCATVEKPVSAEILVSRAAPADKSHTSPILAPAAVYVNGVAVKDLDKGVELNAGANPLLVRYDKGGRGHFVMRDRGVSAPKEKQQLAMKWYGDEGVIPFDVSAGAKQAEWFRFLSAPGTSAIRVHALGDVEAWIDGVPMKAEKNGRFVATKVPVRAAVVALRVKPVRKGLAGGALIPEPVMIETDGSGVIGLGDWSKMGILNNYSGGARYRTSFALTKEEAKSKTFIDLGKVAGTAEIVVNGKPAGIKVAPPWMQDITGLLKEGDNSLEVLVYNTLSNHYQTIPSNYRGNPVSGLLGPVRLRSRDWKEGKMVPADVSASKAAKAVTTVGGMRVTVAAGSLDAFKGKIAAAGNLMRQAGLVASVTGTKGHDGGGNDFSALFNGTAGNGDGGEGTKDDGKTFVGMGDGNTLDIFFDPAKAPKGVTIQKICTYSCHGDARASQCYMVLVSKAAAPDKFVSLAEVTDGSDGGMREAGMETASKAALADGVRILRFVFKNGSAGFNVYREIAVFGQITP